MQSGHSFDNYFGTRPGVDGIPAKVCQPVQVNSTSCVKPYHLSSDQARAGSDRHPAGDPQGHRQGKMDGFVNAQPNATIGSLAMGYLNGADLPYYWNLADRFTLFDHFFAASQAGGLPNRLAPSPARPPVSPPMRPRPRGSSVPTVFDQLDAGPPELEVLRAGLPVQPVTVAGDRSQVPLLAMPHGRPGPRPMPIGSSAPASTSTTSPPGASRPSPTWPPRPTPNVRPRARPKARRSCESLVNALMQSSAWTHTALLLTYDDSGGWYDHAVPPTVRSVTWGPRVPTILVSPYAKAGFVDSQQSDTASIPGLIDQVFHLPPLTPQIATAGDPHGGLDLHQQPISPAIQSHVTLVGARPVRSG